MIVGDIQVQAGEVGQRTAALDQHFLAQQHAPHVRVHQNRVGRLVGGLRAGQRAALQAFLGEAEADLVSALGNPQPLHADHQARRVHHGEHALEAFVRLADQPALGAFEVHHAGGRPLDAHLVLQATAESRVA